MVTLEDAKLYLGIDYEDAGCDRPTCKQRLPPPNRRFAGLWAGRRYLFTGDPGRYADTNLPGDLYSIEELVPKWRVRPAN